MFASLITLLGKQWLYLLTFCLAFLSGLWLLLYPNGSEFFFLDLQYAFSHLAANPQLRSGQLVIVVIDERTQQQLQIRQGVNFRAAHVRMIARLEQAGVAAIGLDIAFQTADADADRDLAAVLKKSGNVVGGEVAELKTLMSLRDSFKALGSLYSEDYWQVPRRVLRNPNNTQQRAFALEIADAFGKGEKASDYAGSWTGLGQKGPGFWINYKYRPDYFPSFSYIDILESGPERINDNRHTPLDFLKGKIVLIGYYQDQFAAPDLTGTKLPGLYVHAYATQNLLHGSALKQLAPVVGLGLLFLTLVLMWYFQATRFRLLKTFAPWLWLILLFCSQAWMLGAKNIWLNYSSLFYSSLLFLAINAVAMRISNRRELKVLNMKLQQFEQFRVKLEELVALKDTLTDLVFHDIKNYVYSLDTGIKLLATRCHDDPHLNKKLDIIRIASRNIESLSKNLLEVKQLEDGRLQLHKTLCTYEWLAAHAREYSRDPLCEISTLQVICDPCSEPFGIEADQYLLERVLHNLFNNAFKYSTPAGEVRLTCQTQAEERVISLFNSSPPLTGEERERVFDKYYQAKITTAYSKGLGLYFCKQVMQAHGGRIWVESTTQGNCFKLGFKKELL